MCIATALLALLLACSSSHPTTNAAPDGAAARFATSYGSTLTLWRATTTNVSLEQTLTLPDPIVDIDWLDANTPVVLFAGQRVARVVDGALVALPSAPATAWIAPRPTSTEDDEALRPGSSPDQLFTFDGQVWIMRCLWEVPRESGSCETMRWVRVHPTFMQQDDAPELPPLPELPTVAGPEGYTLREDRRRTPHGEVMNVTCAAPNQPVFTLPLFEIDEVEGFAAVSEARNPRWIRTSPPSFVVTAVVPGPDAYTAELVVAGCPGTSSGIVHDHRVGASGVWAWTSYSDGWHLEGTASVAPLVVRDLEFAPAR